MNAPTTPRYSDPNLTFEERVKAFFAIRPVKLDLSAVIEQNRKNDIAEGLRLGLATHVPSQPTANGFAVFTSESFMDLSDEQRLRTYPTFEEALAAAQRIVATSLVSQYQEGMTAEQWIEQYQDFGDDPWIRPCPTDSARSPVFSAWKYAEELIEIWFNAEAKQGSVRRDAPSALKSDA